MDNILDRFGIYDFFGVLLPGMVFWIFIIYMGCPIIEYGGFFESEALQVAGFITISYMVGIIVQEIGSFFDKKVTKMKGNACTKFLKPLNEGNVIHKFWAWFVNDEGFSDDELDEMKCMIGRVLNVDDSSGRQCDELSEKQCRTAFYRCKSHLENNKMIGKSEGLNAIFAMSRDMIISNALIILCLFYTIFNREVNRLECADIVIFVYVIVSCVVFFRRAFRFSRMRVRTVLRQYKAVTSLEDKN